MALPIGAALLGSAGIGALGSIMGGNSQEDAANAASAQQMAMFQQTRKDNLPWMQAGQGGLNALMQLYGMESDGLGNYTRASDPGAAMRMLQQDPSYQFRFNQGQGAIENSAAARGGLMSGNTLRALSDYGQNMASTEYSNVANRLAGLSGVGQAGAQFIGNAGMNTASQVGNNMMTSGQARASGYAGVANSLGNAMGQYAMYQGMKGR